MITGTDIIYISSIEWNFLWQIHQEVALRFARAGNRVLYIENTGVRSPGLRDVGRIGSRLKRWASAHRSSGVREVATNVFACSPLVLPPFGTSVRRQVNRKLLLPAVRNAARRLNIKDPLIWTYLPTDTALDLIQLLRTPASHVLYYCVADFSLLTANSAVLRKSEEQLIRQSDLIFATCRSLARHCAQWTEEEISLFPAGVDLEAFPAADFSRLTAVARHGPESDARLTGDVRKLSDLKINGKPVVGYIGGIHRFVDQQLLADMARQRPDWSFVIIGPLQTPAEKLSSVGNLHLLGERPHKHLATYLSYFDACIIPYKIAWETATVVPVKLNEYLAAGKAVVSTELPAVVEFNQRHNVVALSDATSARFIAQLEKMMSRDDDQARRTRRKVAELSDWKLRVEEMSDLIERLRNAEFADETPRAVAS